MARAQLCQRVAQGDVVGLLLLQRLQRGVDGLDEVAEGLLEVVERREPTVGVEQEVAQRLVVLADPGADVGKCLLAVVFGADQALLLTGRAHLDGRWSGWNALTHKKIRNVTHGHSHRLTTIGKSIRLFRSRAIKQRHRAQMEPGSNAYGRPAYLGTTPWMRCSRRAPRRACVRKTFTSAAAHAPTLPESWHRVPRSNARRWEKCRAATTACTRR